MCRKESIIGLCPMAKIDLFAGFGEKRRTTSVIPHAPEITDAHVIFETAIALHLPCPTRRGLTGDFMSISKVYRRGSYFSSVVTVKSIRRRSAACVDVSVGYRTESFDNIVRYFFWIIR